jgi:hypothetical protein
LNHSTLRQGQEIEDEVLGVDIFAKTSLSHLVVDSGPVFLMLLHKLEKEVGLFQRPGSDREGANEFGDGCVDFFLLAFAFLLVLEVALLLIFLLDFLIFLSLFSAALLSLSSFVAFLSAWVKSIIDANLLEIVMGEEEGKIAFAVASDAEDVLILLLREGRVLGVDILHDVGNFLRVETTGMLEPNDSAVDSAVVAIGPQLVCKLLQQLVWIILLGVS